jgi:hypothetical protein
MMLYAAIAILALGDAQMAEGFAKGNHFKSPAEMHYAEGQKARAKILVQKRAIARHKQRIINERTPSYDPYVWAAQRAAARANGR